MLEQLLQGLQGEVGQEVQEKAGINSDMMSQIMKMAGGVAAQHAVKEIAGGGIGNLMNLFSNKPNNSSANSIQGNIANSVVSNLVEKMGIDGGKADMITKMVLPSIMNMITKKNNETPENDTSPLESLFGGNQADGISNLIGGFLK